MGVITLYKEDPWSHAQAPASHNEMGLVAECLLGWEVSSIDTNKPIKYGPVSTNDLTSITTAQDAHKRLVICSSLEP